MKVQVTQELLFSYFAGHASAIQKQMVEEWAKVPANREIFYAWLEAWENQHPQYVANFEQAIWRHQQRLANHAEARDQRSAPLVIKPFWSRIGLFPWLAAASVMLLLLTAAYWTRDTWQYRTLTTAYGETKSFTLPDGSAVTLNANSSLRLPRWGFGQRNRLVFLEGEASFSVKHTANHQKFIVQTAKQFSIEVLGTEFSVFARQRKAKVVLSQGKIRLSYLSGRVAQNLVMTPGDLITLDSQNHARLTKTAQPQIHLSWQGHRYVFEQTTLQEIIYLLDENYGIKVQVADPTLLSLTLSGAFTADNADQLLQVVEGVLNVQATRQKDYVLITQRNL